MPLPSLSVLVPTLNGAEDLRRLLPALRVQDYGGSVEWLAIDSSSDDDTVALLEDAGFQVEVIPRASFGHGRTRNALAARARGERVVFLSQDAVPQGAGFLSALAGALDRPGVVGATARVLPQPDDDPLTARTVLEAAEADERPDERALPPGATLAALPGPERARILRFNNVASCLRRDVLLAIPFPDVPFGEDAAWAAAALTAGHRLRHEPLAVVRHAHRYGPGSAYRRYRQDAAFHRAFHGHRARPGLLSVIKGCAYECRRDLAFVARRGGWTSLARSPFLRPAPGLGQSAGGRRPGPSWEAAVRAGHFVPLAPQAPPLLPHPREVHPTP